MWLKKVGFGCTVFSDHHFQILCTFSFPRQPWRKLVYKLWGFAAVPRFSGSVLLLLLSYWGRTLVHWHCKQKAAALCLYEFQAHIKYEGSLSTPINFGDNSSSPHITNKGRESGKKEHFGEYLALTLCNQHWTTLVCWLPNLSKQSEESCFITAQVTECSSRRRRSFQIFTSNIQMQKKK